VPRLEPVSALLSVVTGSEHESDGAQAADTPAAQVLRLAMEVDRLELQGLNPQSVLETLRTIGDFSPALLDTLERVSQADGEELERAEIPVSELEVGMVLDEDLHTSRDVLIAPRGCDVTPSFLEHIRHFVKELAKPKVLVFRRSPLAAEGGSLVPGQGALTG
jgi:hypothetical protein